MSRQEPPLPASPPPPPHLEIEIIEPDPEDCQDLSLPPEGNVKLRNYRLLADNLRAYTPTGDIHTSPTKRKLVPRFEPCSTLAPPRERILELVRPGDPGREALEAIVRPAPRRGLQRPLDDDTRRFLQRALLSPSPLLATPEPHGVTPEPRREHALSPESRREYNFSPVSRHEYTLSPDSRREYALSPDWRREYALTPTPERMRTPEPPSSHNERAERGERSLAEELREAEAGGGGWCGGGGVSRQCPRRAAVERERLGRLALADEAAEGAADWRSADGALGAAARRLDALLVESRALHAELAGIHDDMQVLLARQASAASAPARR